LARDEARAVEAEYRLKLARARAEVPRQRPPTAPKP
jgi:hypothetical protein